MIVDNTIMQNDFEHVGLQLLCELHSELHRALDSMRAKKPENLMETFCVLSAAHIYQASEGYILLRKASRIHASSLLIRPAIEAMIRIQAVQNSPELLYRIAYTEFEENKKWLRPSTTKAGKNVNTEAAIEWNQFKQSYENQFPLHNLKDLKLTIRDAAQHAGMVPYYDSRYRLYCKFTHVAFTAITGSLDSTSIADTPTMSDCVLCGLVAADFAGGKAPNLGSLQDRLLRLADSSQKKT